VYKTLSLVTYKYHEASNNDKEIAVQNYEITEQGKHLFAIATLY
jgi:hypothetical protein